MATRATKRQRSTIEPARVAEILVDAMALGAKAAAKKWKISVRTIERYRVIAAGDTALSASVAEKVGVENGRWAGIRLRFLRAAIAKLELLVASATLENMRDVVGAVKIVGELHLVNGALGDPDEDGKQPFASVPTQEPAEDARRAPAGGASTDGTGGVH